MVNDPSAGAMPSRVFAVAVPVAAGALLEPGRVVTAATVGELLVDDRDDGVVVAAAALADAGFEVLQTTRLMVNIAGPAELYETTFGVRLFTEEREVVKPGSRRDLATFIDCADSDVSGLVPAGGSALADVVSAVAIEEPYYPASLVPDPAPGPGPVPGAVSAEPPEVDYWHLTLPDQLAAALRADATHADGITGEGVRVAMVDTGFQQHPFFTAHGYRVEPTVPGPGTTLPEIDESGHGTGEAANVFAAAPAATLLPVKTATASGALVNVTAAFSAAVALGPQIITNSWGSSQPDPPLSAANQALAAAVAAAAAEGIVVVFSAGNGGWGFPGQHPDVISAGGVYQERDGSLRASDYASGFASRLYPGRDVPDLSGLVGLLPRAMYLMLPVPPGCAIDRDQAGGVHPDGDQTAPDDGWAAFSGTSAAAPQIAGVCALLAQASPGVAPEEVREVVRATARDVAAGVNHPTFGHEAVAGPDLATGAGLVDASAAVAALRTDAGGGGAGDGSGAAVGPGPGGDAGAVDGAEPTVSDDGGTVVALVMLQPASGHSPSLHTVATSGTWLPARRTVAEVSARLAASDFQVGAASGPTLSIEASVTVFREMFGVGPVRAADGGWTTAVGDELPLDALPPELRALVLRVVLERPAEMHGGGS